MNQEIGSGLTRCVAEVGWPGICIHSVRKAKNNELAAMGRIFITLCPVGQPKQRKYQPFKSPDYDNNSRKTKDLVCGVGGGRQNTGP